MLLCLHLPVLGVPPTSFSSLDAGAAPIGSSLLSGSRTTKTHVKGSKFKHQKQNGENGRRSMAWGEPGGAGCGSDVRQAAAKPGLKSLFHLEPGVCRTVTTLCSCPEQARRCLATRQCIYDLAAGLAPSLRGKFQGGIRAEVPVTDGLSSLTPSSQGPVLRALGPGNMGRFRPWGLVSPGKVAGPLHSETEAEPASLTGRRRSGSQVRVQTCPARPWPGALGGCAVPSERSFLSVTPV